MPRTLSNGYTVTRVEGIHNVSGEPVRSLRDDDVRAIIVTDNGDPDALLDATAEAVDDSYIELARQAKQRAGESAIEVLDDLWRKSPSAPIIPQIELPPRIDGPSEA